MRWHFLFLYCLLCIVAANKNASSIVESLKNSTTHVSESLNIPVSGSLTSNRLSSHSCSIRRDTSDLSSNSTFVNRPLRIVISASGAYLRPLLNWLVYFNNVCPDISNLYIVCLDVEIEFTLPKYGLSCGRVIHSSMIAGHIWLWRARVVKDLLAHGYDVLMSDTDAIWLRNPFTALESFPNSDIISSRGAFPQNIAREIGACACLGFIYIKASKNSVTLWDDLLLRMQQTKEGLKDDQLEFNKLLWQSRLKYHGGKSVVKVSNNTVPNTGTFLLQLSRPMTITLLPQHQFMRECSGKSVQIHASTVAHCIAIHKTGQSKEDALKVYGLFSLRRKWDETPITRFDELLARITEPGSIATGFKNS